MFSIHLTNKKKKSMEATRRLSSFSTEFFFNDKCPERIMPARAHQMCERKSLRSQDSHSLILTENGLALYRSDLSLHVCTQK